MRNHLKYAGVLSVLCVAMLVVMTVIASSLSSVYTFLPLVALHRPTPTPSSTGLLLITEVLYNPSNDLVPEPKGEWVEIYNPGPGPVILSAYKLGDETSQGGKEGMLQFPAGTMLYPGEVIIVANYGAAFKEIYGFPPDFEMDDTDPNIPVMLKYRYWSTGKVELVNSGDEIILLDGNDTIIDALSWGDSNWKEAFDPPPPSAGDDESLERSPVYSDSDSASDWVVAENPGPYQLDLSTPTPVIPTGPTILLVSEVFYNPSLDNPAGEWVEIYNAGENNARLSVYRVGDEETRGGGEGMYSFPDGSVLLIGQAAVIANQSVVFEASYGFKPDYEISESDAETPNMVKDSDWASGGMNLSASGDEVILLDLDDSIVDGVSWGNSAVLLDPAVPGVEPDHAIERYPVTPDTDSAADWRDQLNPDPGQVNLSQPTSTPMPEPPPRLIINEIHADPDPSLGDANGDGVIGSAQDEFLEIVNTTANDIDISGWEIYDFNGSRHVFTDTLILPAGCAVVIFGGGTPMGEFGSAIVQISSTGSLKMNNEGDTITLYDLNDTVVVSYTYGTEGGHNQALARDPDITGPDPMIKHSLVTDANGALFSPGTRVDGTPFEGCTPSTLLKHTVRRWSP